MTNDESISKYSKVFDNTLYSNDSILKNKREHTAVQRQNQLCLTAT